MHQSSKGYVYISALFACAYVLFTCAPYNEHMHTINSLATASIKFGSRRRPGSRIRLEREGEFGEQGA